MEEIQPTVEECPNSLESESEEENSITESSGRLRPRSNLQIPLQFRKSTFLQKKTVYQEMT